MVTTRRLTAADLEAMGEEGELLELLDGEVLEAKRVGMAHGAIAGEIHIIAGAYARQYRLGRFFSSDTQFQVEPSGRGVLRPDVAFVSFRRLPEGTLPNGICPFAPELAVEVISPSNNEIQVLRKISAYLAAGTRVVWLVRPAQQTVTVFASDQPERILTAADTLDGGEVLPGFALPLSELFRSGLGPDPE